MPDQQLLDAFPSTLPAHLPGAAILDNDLDAFSSAQPESSGQHDSRLDMFPSAKPEPQVTNDGFSSQTRDAVTSTRKLSVFESVKNANLRGKHQARQTMQMLIAVTTPKTLIDFADDIVATRKAMRDIPVGRDLEELAEAGEKGILAAFGKAIANPLDIVLPLIVESLRQYVQVGVPITAAGAAAGAAAGLAGGPFAPLTVPLGTRIGAGVGAGAAGLLLEASAEFFEEVEQAIVTAGDDPDDPDSWRKHLADEALVSRAKSIAFKKGVPIALFDAASIGVAGRIAKVGRGIASPVRKVINATGEIAVQGAFDFGGEFTGQLYSRGEIDPAGLVAEVAAGVGQSVVEVAAGTALERGRGGPKAEKIATFFVNGKERNVTQEQADRIASIENTPSRNDLKGIVRDSDKLNAGQRVEIKESIQEQLDAQTRTQRETTREPAQAEEAPAQAQEELAPAGTAQVQALDRSTGEIAQVSVTPEDTSQMLREERRTRVQLRQLQNCLSGT